MNDYKFKVYYIDIQDSDDIQSTQKQLEIANAKLILQGKLNKKMYYTT